MLGYFKYLINIFKPTPLLHVSFDLGNKHKKTVVLLHGIAATSKSWDKLIKELGTDNYRIVAIDLLGFGQSPKPESIKYSVEDHTASVRKTIRKLKLRKPYIIVGHSLGAIIAANYSRRYHHEVNKMYLLSPPIYLDKNVSQTGISRKLTDIYLDTYRYISDKKDFTIKNSQFIRKLIGVKDGMDVNKENWNGFRLSLINAVVKQDFYNDIKYSIPPVEILYGALDHLLIQESINKLEHFDNVKIFKLQFVDHLIGPRFAKELAKRIIESH